MKVLAKLQKASVVLIAASISLAYGSAIANGIEFPTDEMPPLESTGFTPITSSFVFDDGSRQVLPPEIIEDHSGHFDPFYAVDFVDEMGVSHGFVVNLRTGTLFHSIEGGPASTRRLGATDLELMREAIRVASGEPGSGNAMITIGIITIVIGLVGLGLTYYLDTSAEANACARESLRARTDYYSAQRSCQAQPGMVWVNIGTPVHNTSDEMCGAGIGGACVPAPRPPRSPRG